MTESLKFGPEWLRNTISNSPPKEEEILSRAVLSNYRYSREEMLCMINEKNSKKTPEILPNYKRLYIASCQTPLAMLQIEEERPAAHSRLFLNSNIKQHHAIPNWRKGKEEPAAENWRHKDNNPSSIGKNGLKQSWRDKSNEDGLITTHQSERKSEPFSRKYESIETEKLPEWARYSPPNNSANKSSEWEIDKAQLFSPFDSLNAKRHEVKKKVVDPEIDDCELNLKKLEKDLLMNLSDMTIDDEKKPENNKQQDLLTWFYIDPLGKVQGPFKEEEMTLWYQHGFFCDTLMLRRSIDSNFISLQQLIHAFGNAQPFVVASTGFPIPKFDNPVENTFKPPPPKPPVLNQPVSNNIQWNNMMVFNDQNRYQQSSMPFHPPPQQAYPYVNNRQPIIPQQIDPRILNNPYIQTYNNLGVVNQQQNMPPPPLINQVIKTQMSAPMVNNFSQSMIQQMPSIIPPNPIQKLLYELQKQKEIEQQRQAMFYQHNNLNNSNNVLIKSINDQIMLQQQQQQQHMKKIENINQNQKVHQNYFSSNNNNNNHHHQMQQVQQEKAVVNFDADDEGEFKVVGNLKRKKFQKEAKEKPEKAKSEVYHQLSKTSVPKINPTNNCDGTTHEKKVNEERSKLPALPAPWIDKVKKDYVSSSENLKRIQLEEEEIRNIEKQLKREKEQQEMKQKTTQLTWNTILTDKIEHFEEQHKAHSVPKAGDSIWNERQKTLKVNNNNNKKTNRQQNKQQPPKQDPKMKLNVEKENEFKNWCIEMLNKMNTKIDIPVFVNFLAGLESPFEIEDYVKMYLGDCIESTLFSRKFLERRSSYRKATKIVEIDDELLGPPKAINPSSSEEIQKAHRKNNKGTQSATNNKKSRKTMKVADATILGFKGTAASNRIVGELHEDEY